MKKLLQTITIISIFILYGCEEGIQEVSYETNKLICKVEDAGKISSHTNECISSANPKSDEEPEDWIGICMKNTKQLFCEETLGTITKRKNCNQCGWYETKFIPNLE